MEANKTHVPVDWSPGKVGRRGGGLALGGEQNLGEGCSIMYVEYESDRRGNYFKIGGRVTNMLLQRLEG